MRTIAAIATPLINSAIHIIRISGPDTFKIVQKICKHKINIKPNSIQHNFIVDKNLKIVDEVLLNIFVGPKSFTGENIIEINCHGGNVVTKKIFNLLLINGCEAAKNGEFSQQAYLNNKISYMQIEAMNNLINASTEKAADISMQGLVDSNNSDIKKIRDKIFDIMGSIEVNIDYPEYDDVPNYTNQEIIIMLKKLNQQIRLIINNSKMIAPIFHGLNISIIGLPNTGKSSLLNFLLNDEKAIVSNIKGTTRDIVEGKFDFYGLPINLLDTAGIRKSTNQIEKMGIKKTLDVINKSDLIIYLVENQKQNQTIVDLLTNKNFIKVNTKADKYDYPKNEINISVKNHDINSLVKRLKKEVGKIINFSTNDLILQSDRQITLMEKIEANILDAINSLQANATTDLIQSNLEESIKLFNNILGYNFDYDKLDELFCKFCLGK